MNVRVDVSVPPSGSRLGQEQKKIRLDLHVVPDSRTTKEATVSSLCQSLEEALPDIHAYRCKLIHSGRLIPLWSGQQNDSRKLKDFGIQNGSVLKVMLSPKSAIDVVNSMKELPRMPDVEYERERERRRRADHPTSTQISQFVGSIEPWDCPKNAYPDQNEARKLLRAVANDAAIVHIMAKHRWRIGILSEMPPMGRVGISPVCLLGCNINQGQEITLRLRTDDMKGFRKFDMIRKTMIHELAHMVYSEHDDDFKNLNSRLNREAQEILSRKGHTLTGVEVYSPQKDDSTPGPHRFAKDDWARRYDGDATAAARHAALHRHGAARFSKGDKVRYFNKRNNTWQDAKILAIDYSVQPPSYGIEIYEHGEVHQRETEESRLDTVPMGGGGEVPEDSIRGLGHQDATTRALEHQVSGTLE